MDRIGAGRPARGKGMLGGRLLRNLRKDWILLAIIAPVLVFFIVFHYIPMYGVVIAFKQFNPVAGILRSPWVGLRNFERFFGSVYFLRTMRNTVVLSLYGIAFSFPIPIMFALLLNELRAGVFKSSIQTISYLPHFISVVVIVGMMVSFLSPNDGIVNAVIRRLGGEPVNFLMQSKYFRSLYIGSDIWQSFGWNSIIYLAALSGIDPELYEAARIDGASRIRQILHITIPGLLPTIVILLILRTGMFLNVGYEKIILLYNPATYETADILSTFIYRRGLLESNYSFGAAVGLFTAAVNFVLLLSVNRISRRASEISIW